MQNTVIAIILLTLILSGVCVVSLKIDRACEEIAALIDGGHCESAVEYWRGIEPFAAIFIHDAKIDAVNTEALMLELDYGDEKSALRLREAISELQSSELPNAENIL